MLDRLTHFANRLMGERPAHISPPNHASIPVKRSELCAWVGIISTSTGGPLNLNSSAIIAAERYAAGVKNIDIASGLKMVADHIGSFKGRTPEQTRAYKDVSRAVETMSTLIGNCLPQPKPQITSLDENDLLISSDLLIPIYRHHKLLNATARSIATIHPGSANILNFFANSFVINLPADIIEHMSTEDIQALGKEYALSDIIPAHLIKVPAPDPHNPTIM